MIHIYIYDYDNSEVEGNYYFLEEANAIREMAKYLMDRMPALPDGWETHCTEACDEGGCDLCNMTGRDGSMCFENIVPTIMKAQTNEPITLIEIDEWQNTVWGEDWNNGRGDELFWKDITFNDVKLPREMNKMFGKAVCDAAAKRMKNIVAFS